VDYEGPLTALRVFGYVAAGRYAAPIRFYDPATATAADLTAVAVRTDSPASAVIHNTTGLPVEVSMELVESSLVASYSQTIGTVTLQPNGVHRVDLSSSLATFSNRGRPFANLRVRTTASNGALVGALTQVDSSNIVEDIPLRTSNPPAFDRGSYPLRWVDDYRNQVSITNTTDRILGSRALITAGDIVYVLPKISLEPNTTKIYDVDEMRRDGVPDVNNVVLPVTAQYGKFLWAELSNGQQTGLLGRQSLSSLHNFRRSSFSCGEYCVTSSVIDRVFLNFPQQLLYGASNSSTML